MTDVLAPNSYGVRSPRASGGLSTGLGWLVAAWISFGLWAGLFALAAGLLALVGLS